MMKNDFYFILKALSAFNIFKFLSWLSGFVEKMTMLEKIGLTSKFMTSQTGQQTITMHTYFSISHEVKATSQWNLISPLW